MGMDSTAINPVSLQAKEQRQVDKILKGVEIPAQPKTVLDIYRLMNEPDPDFRKIAELVTKDVALSAKVIKLINSPFWGVGRKIATIKDALLLLGLKKFYKYILTSSLHDALAGKNSDNEKFGMFWKHCLTTAQVCELISRKSISLSGLVSPEQAHLAGLFHDCGVPLLMRKFPKYAQLSDSALGGESSVLCDEDEGFGTNHCLVGCFMTRSWGLATDVCQAIQYHHDAEWHIGDCLASRKLWAVLVVAEHIVEDISAAQANNMQPVCQSIEYEWEDSNRNILEELYMDDDDMIELKEKAFNMVAGR